MCLTLPLQIQFWRTDGSNIIFWSLFNFEILCLYPVKVLFLRFCTEIPNVTLVDWSPNVVHLFFNCIYSRMFWIYLVGLFYKSLGVYVSVSENMFCVILTDKDYHQLWLLLLIFVWLWGNIICINRNGPKESLIFVVQGRNETLY